MNKPLAQSDTSVSIKRTVLKHGSTTTKCKTKQKPQEKMPDVFNRLSQCHLPKNEQKEELTRYKIQPFKDNKIPPSKVKLNKSLSNNKLANSRNDTTPNGRLSPDSEHEKALREEIPEKTNKDTEESLHFEPLSSGFVSSPTSSNATKCHQHIEVHTSESLSTITSQGLQELKENLSNISVGFNVSEYSSKCIDKEEKELLKDELDVSPKLGGRSDQVLVQVPSDVDIPNTSGTNFEKKQFSLPALNTIELFSKFSFLKINSKKPPDADKDICEDDKIHEDDKFFDVKVHTRNVKYEKSTLSIRNTSNMNSSTEPQHRNHNVPRRRTEPLLLWQPSTWSTASEGKIHTPNEGRIGKFLARSQNARNSLEKYMTKGKSFLNGVRNGNYIPNINLSTNNNKIITSREASPNSVSTPDEFDAQRFKAEHFRASEKFTKPSQTESIKSPALANEVDEISVLAVNPKEISSSGTSDADTEPTDDPTYASQSEPDYSFLFPECICQLAQLAGNENQNEANNSCMCWQNSHVPLEVEELLDVDRARMWWTITGNFGNILPIDWSKTYTRKKYLPVLNLNERKKSGRGSETPSVNASPRADEDDDQVAQDLDLHQLILANPHHEQEPVKSADEVIREIDDIMQEGSSSEDEGIEDGSSESKTSQQSIASLPPPLYHEKLKNLGVTELNEILLELEMTIGQYSETLINELALRDELEYEKELKNTFISLLLQVQNKRRIFNVEKKKPKKPLGSNVTDPKYLTTVIPYNIYNRTPTNQTVQILIKILTAINDDSPTVPTLLTDYILKVLCPS